MLLGEVVFTSETASGWQSVSFSAPVAIEANTPYVASYHTDTGNYSLSRPYFNTGYYNAPLYAYGTNEVTPGNGVYHYGSNRSFPDQTWEASNYWVDVVFAAVLDPNIPHDLPVLSALNVNPASVISSTSSTGTVILNGPAPSGGAEIGLSSSNQAAMVPATVTVAAGDTTATFVITTLAVSASTAVTITATYSGDTQTVLLTLMPAQNSLWDDATMPRYSTAGDGSAIELGIKFRSDVAGYVTGLRFYKDASNVGTHYGHLWTIDGTLLAEVIFTGETASGWQSARFSAPVAIEANTPYIVSYHTDTGNYSLSRPYFNTGYYNAPLYAYATNEVTFGNGVYHYGSNRSFPDQTWEASNYWVDVIFGAVTNP
jgi:hypothetical protein